MKTYYGVADSTALCPWTLFNTCQPFNGNFLPKERLPKQFSDIILNGTLLGSSKGYGVISEAQKSPAPKNLLFGVEALTSVSEKARREANAQAKAQLLSQSPDHQVLARYSGGGSIGESVNEYYTPQVAAQVMWDCLGKLPKEARILEPGCGTGAILAQAPEGVYLTGVELSTVSAQIAKILLPHAAIHQMPAEIYHTTSTDPLYDAVIMNPPFGPRSARHLDDKNEGKNEYYFIKMALNRVKHQYGLVSVLCNLNIAGEKTHESLRRYIQQFGQVIHHVVVPTSAFEKAGARVSTVILSIRRHDLGVQEALSTLSDTEQDAVIACLLPKHSRQQDWIKGEMVYRRETDKNNQIQYHLTERYSSELRLSKEMMLNVGRFDQPEYTGELDYSPERRADIQNAVSKSKTQNLFTLNNVLAIIFSLYGQKTYDKALEASKTAHIQPIAIGTHNPEGTYVMTPEGWKATEDFANPVIADALSVSQALQKYLLHAQETRGQLLRELTLKLDKQYRETHGPYPEKKLSRLAGRFSSLALLLSHLKESKLELPISQKQKLNITGSVTEVARQLADLLLLDEQTLSEYAAISVQEAQDFLLKEYCFNGDTWLPKGIYYSGNAYTKSNVAKAMAQSFTGFQAQALKNQAGEFLRLASQKEIEPPRQFSPRDPILSSAILEEWVNHELSSVRQGKNLLFVNRENGAVKITLKADEQGNLYTLSAGSEKEVRELQDFLNHKTRVPSIQGASEMTKTEKAAERSAAMEQAADYENRMNASFQAWLESSPYLIEVRSAYIHARQGHLSAAPLTTPLPVEWHGPPPHPYQNADARIMATQEGECAGYGVGVGKTFLGLLLAGYLLTLGRITKPVIVCPAGLIANWMTNATLCYPHLKILAIGMSPVLDKEGRLKQKQTLDGKPMFDEKGQPIYEWKEDSAQVRQKKLGQLASGEADLYIMSREVYTSIPLSEETLSRLISQDVQYLTRVESKDKFDSTGKRGRHDTIKRMEEFTASCLKKVKESRTTDLCFEALGIDATFLDESQAYKNLVSAPSVYGESVKFIGGGAESNRALDANYKNRYVRAKGGKTYTFTASWVKNSPLEIWTSLALVTDMLPELGLPTVESMMEQYLKIEPRIITTLEGEVAVKPAAVGFTRLKELSAIIASRITVRKPGDPEVILSTGKPMHVPKVEDIEYPFDMTPEQSSYYQKLRQEAANSSGKSGDEHTFSVMWRMRKTTLDPVLTLGEGHQNPRFEAVSKIALQERASGGKSLVFMSIGEKEGSFERLKETLIASGYPAEEIEVVTSSTHKTSVARQDLEDRYNYGGLTCLLLSTVAEEGFNLQIGTTAIIHCDTPWNFQSVNQRVGRGARQGNTQEVVRNYFLLQRGTFDTLTFTTLKGKRAWEDQLGGNVDEVENTASEFNADEIALLLAQDPEAMKEKIAEKRKELAERSGKAAQKRRFMALMQTWFAQFEFKQVLSLANSRKKGWTARDYLRVGNARSNYQRHLSKLENIETFPMRRILDFKGRIQWEYGIPLHEGMKFKMENQELEVWQLRENTVTCKDTNHTLRSLSSFQIFRQGYDFAPAPDPNQYKALSFGNIQEAQVSLSDNVIIQAMNGLNVNPATSSEQVITIALNGEKVENLTGASGMILSTMLQGGRTVIHYLTVDAEQDTAQSGTADQKGNVTVEHIIVLCPNSEITQRTKNVLNHPAFKERLSSIIKTTLSS